LTAITKQSPSLTERFAAHKAASKYVKDSLTELGFGFVPLNRDIAANGMTAVRYPKGITAADILPKLAEWVSLTQLHLVSITEVNYRKDIVVAGGLHRAIASEYFRVGHMGVTVTDESRGDLKKVVKGIKAVLEEKGWKKD
jgi:alanine-glyoxylate transaminase/serine-glyoxylate transaminase/serine-pyruvate transaminase